MPERGFMSASYEGSCVSICICSCTAVLCMICCCCAVHVLSFCLTNVLHQQVYCTPPNNRRHTDTEFRPLGTLLGVDTLLVKKGPQLPVSVPNRAQQLLCTAQRAQKQEEWGRDYGAHSRKNTDQHRQKGMPACFGNGTSLWPHSRT